MWMWIANKLAKFHLKRLNQTENIPKSFFGVYFFLKHMYYVCLQQEHMKTAETIVIKLSGSIRNDSRITL